MEDQAIISPSQGLTETQAIELLKQRRVAAKAPAATPASASQSDEPTPAPAQELSADQGEDDLNAESDVALEAEDEGTQDPANEPVINYVVDGKPEAATIDEAKKALASVKHLNRLRNEIVESHKTISTQTQEVQTQRQELATRLQEVEQLLMSGLPTPQQMQQMLDANDTAGYLKGQQAHARYMQVRQYREQQTAQSTEQQNAQRAQREQAEAAELVKARPEFAKPDYVQKVYSFLTEDNGFDADAVASLGARELMLADDARKWQEWNRNKTLGIQKAVAKSAPPSKAPVQTPQAEKQIIDLRTRLRQSGNQSDAIALLKLKRQLTRG